MQLVSVEHLEDSERVIHKYAGWGIEPDHTSLPSSMQGVGWTAPVGKAAGGGRKPRFGGSLRAGARWASVPKR